MPTQKVNLTELECFCHVNNKFRNEIKYFESKRQLSGKGVNMEQTQKYKKQDFFHKLLTEKKSFQSLLVHTCDIFSTAIQQLFWKLSPTPYSTPPTQLNCCYIMQVASDIFSLLPFFFCFVRILFTRFT